VDEKEGNCDHQPQSCSDSATVVTSADGVFGSDKGDIGLQLGEIAKANPEVAIGSYPFFGPQHRPNTNVVLRARDAQKLALAKRAVEDMLERVRGAQSRSG